MDREDRGVRRPGGPPGGGLLLAPESPPPQRSVRSWLESLVRRSLNQHLRSTTLKL